METAADLVDEYIGQLKALYADVRTWIHEHDPGTTIKPVTVEVIEEASGPYRAPGLEISRRGWPTHVRMEPVGRWIVGALGRVDMKSAMDTETLVLIVPPGPIWTVEEHVGRAPASRRPRPVPAGALKWAWSENKLLGQYPPLTGKLFHKLLVSLTS